jgi:hypothetical protein
MTSDNLTRMIKLAEEFFEVKNDPRQLAISPEVREQLLHIHPRTMNEKSNPDGPIAWVLLIPTSSGVMEDFLNGRISEREILEKTEAGTSYEAIYLCSALVLPEHRNRGLARTLTIEAIGSIRKDHPITALFYWSFSEGGEKLAASVA